MDWVEKVLEKIREWVERVIDTLLGDPQPQPQPIPIPVEDGSHRRR
jgi:predicted RNase H-like HicB family nuclease